jgi:putative transposase
MSVAVRHNADMDDETKRKIALWRFGVLGPLVSARLEHGDRAAWFRAAAERVHQLPDGRVVKLSPRTIESWYQAYQHGGFEALVPETRSDHRTSRSIRAEVAELILRAKGEKPRRSIQRIIRMLERAGVVGRHELSRSSVHRLLQVHGVSARPVRGPSAERRSFLHEHAGDLWVGDAMHGPLVLAQEGGLKKSYMLSIIDGATRFVVHSHFTLAESAVEQERVFKQALLKHGRPRIYYVDRGPAYIAHSLRLICAELGIRHINTETEDPEAKGVIERWHETWRAEVGDELPPEPMALAELNARHWAWLSVEYLARIHDTTRRAPREHWLADAHQLRPLPRDKNLDEVFLHRARRTVRKDGTVRFGGGYLEVRPEIVGKIELRFDPTDPGTRPRVFIHNRFVCDTVPLDRSRNASRVRRRSLGAPAPGVTPSGLDPLALIQREHDAHARPAGIDALALHDSNDDSDDDDTEG